MSDITLSIWRTSYSCLPPLTSYLWVSNKVTTFALTWTWERLMSTQSSLSFPVVFTHTKSSYCRINESITMLMISKSNNPYEYLIQLTLIRSITKRNPLKVLTMTCMCCYISVEYMKQIYHFQECQGMQKGESLEIWYDYLQLWGSVNLRNSFWNVE